MPQQSKSEIRDSLCKYLLVEPDSQSGNRLVETLISIHTLIKIRNLRGQNIVVYLQGDAYFCDLIGNLLNCWGVEPRLGDGTSSKDYKCFDLYAPGPAERKEDLPAIISYFVGELTENLRQHSIKVPQKICGETILFLLAYPHWYGFGHIYKFLELSLAGDWAEEDTITLFKAQELTWETFAGETPVFSENDHAREDAERFAKGMEEQTGKESLLYDVNMHFSYENRFKVHYVDYYLYVEPVLGCSIAHSFELDRIKQVMDNACVLSGLFSSRPRLDEAQQENIDKIIQLRFQKGRAGTKFDQDNEACDNLVWHGWDKEEEIQAVVDMCERKENYDSFMAGLHFNLSFSDPDTTYADKQTAERSLGIHVPQQKAKEKLKATNRDKLGAPNESSFKEYRLRFKDGYTISVYVPGNPKPRHVDYKDLIMENKKEKKPNDDFEVLIKTIENDGWLTYELIPEKTKGALKANVSRINKAFNAFFEPNDNVFERYQKKRGWELKPEIVRESMQWRRGDTAEILDSDRSDDIESISGGIDSSDD